MLFNELDVIRKATVTTGRILFFSSYPERRRKEKQRRYRELAYVHTGGLWYLAIPFPSTSRVSIYSARIVYISKLHQCPKLEAIFKQFFTIPKLHVLYDIISHSDWFKTEKWNSKKILHHIFILYFHPNLLYCKFEF